MSQPNQEWTTASAPSLAGEVVLQVLPALEEGGVERGTVEMVQALVASGAVALVASAGGRLVAHVERAGGHHVVLPLLTKDPVNILLNARRLRRLIQRERVSLVHARSRAPAWSALLAARRARVPFLTTWHGVYSENFPGKRRYNAVMAKGERVIAISEFVASRVARDYGVGPDRLRVIPRGADPVVFDPARVAGDRLYKMARAWRLPDGAPVILLPGRISAWKGHALLIEALGRVRDRSVIAVFTGTGSASLVKSLCERARALGLEERLRFTGHCADMAAAYALASVVVAPSLAPEPFGRVVVEAQAMGRLVIVADHGGAAETVEHGMTGWRVPPGDVDTLAASLEAGLALDAEALHAFGTAARQSVIDRFSTARMQAATLGVYAELLGRAPAQAGADHGPDHEDGACASW